jgi:hypothetical protein
MAWNLEDGAVEDKRVMVRTTDKPHATILKLLGMGDTSLSEVMQFPTTRRELFDKLQLRLVVFFKDRIEVKAVFPMPDILNQECTLTRGKGEGEMASPHS